jgi:hypothetical protein
VSEDGIIRGLSLTGLAETEDLVAVMHGPEGKFPTDLLLERLQIRTVELDDGITVQADQVVMVFIAPDRLVVRMLVAEAALSYQPTLHKQIQGSVDRGPTDGLPLLFQRHVQLVGVEVAGLAKDLLDQFQTLSGQLQLTGPQKSLEALLFFGPVDLGLTHGILGGKSTRIVSDFAFYK